MSVVAARLHVKQRDFSEFSYRLHKEGKKIKFDSLMEFLEDEMDKLKAVGSARDIECCRKLRQSTASVTTPKSQPTTTKPSQFKIKSENLSDHVMLQPS